MHRARAIGITLSALSIASPSFAAQDFTFTAVGADGVAAWVKLDGRNIGATSSPVVSTATGPDGKVTVKHGQCQSWTPEASSEYSYETVCNYIDKEGSYATITWCPKVMIGDCSGKLIGVSGAFANMTGTLVVHTKPAKDDKTDNYTGSGHWN